MIAGHEFNDETYKFLKQRTEKCFAIRAESTVTGSTRNAALDHYDCILFGKAKNQVRDLWSMIQKELEIVYLKGCRPIKNTENIPNLKDKIDSYIDSQVQFLGELVSVKGIECPSKKVQ